MLGLATTGASVAIGLALKRPPIIALGVIGFFVFDIRVFFLYVRGAGAALAAFILGLCLVAFAVWHATHESPGPSRRRSTGFEAGNGHPDSFEPS